MKHASAALALCWILFGCQASQDAEPLAAAASPSRAEAGREVFASYCASCHGPEARGDGPVAKRLRTPPADLTRIAVRAAGSFDAASVAAFIDGRNVVPEHGPSDMPVWGRSFDDRNANLSDETRLHPGEIFQIVEFLRTIQVSE